MPLKYIGAAGRYIAGVPARDLTDEEAAIYADIIAQYEPGIYEPVKTEPPAKAVKEELDGSTN